MVDCGGYHIDAEDPYVKRHEHKNAITVNPDLASNPDLVAYFGEEHFPMLQNQQFDLIAVEGSRISDTPEGRKELARITSKTGQILNVMADGVGRQFSWEDNALNCWADNYVLPPPVPGFEKLPEVNETFKY